MFRNEPVVFLKCFFISDLPLLAGLFPNSFDERCFQVAETLIFSSLAFAKSHCLPSSW
jgi:hypothetical protein